MRMALSVPTVAADIPRLRAMARMPCHYLSGGFVHFSLLPFATFSPSPGSFGPLCAKPRPSGDAIEPGDPAALPGALWRQVRSGPVKAKVRI